MEMFLNAAQLKMVHVPYQGGGPSFNALLSGQVPVVPTLESTAKGQIDAGNPFMQDKAVIERFEKAGSQVSYLDGPEFARFLEADTDRLLKVVRHIGLS